MAMLCHTGKSILDVVIVMMTNPCLMFYAVVFLRAMLDNTLQYHREHQPLPSTMDKTTLPWPIPPIVPPSGLKFRRPIATWTPAHIGTNRQREFHRPQYMVRLLSYPQSCSKKGSKKGSNILYCKYKQMSLIHSNAQLMHINLEPKAFVGCIHRPVDLYWPYSSL